MSKCCSELFKEWNQENSLNKKLLNTKKKVAYRKISFLTEKGFATDLSRYLYKDKCNCLLGKILTTIMNAFKP
jgi:hypothetical protein